MEVFRANLQLLEEQQMYPELGAPGPYPPHLPPTTSASFNPQRPHSECVQSPPPSLHPDPNPTQTFIHQLPNINNNTLAMKPYCLPLYPSPFPEATGQLPLLPGGPLIFPPPALRQLQLATQHQPVVVASKLKAAPSLISLPPAREHKYMPY